MYLVIQCCSYCVQRVMDSRASVGAKLSERFVRRLCRILVLVMDQKPNQHVFERGTWRLSSDAKQAWKECQVGRISRLQHLRTIRISGASGFHHSQFSFRQRSSGVTVRKPNVIQTSTLVQRAIEFWRKMRSRWSESQNQILQDANTSIYNGPVRPVPFLPTHQASSKGVGFLQC
jgi:hypothetical protein